MIKAIGSFLLLIVIYTCYFVGAIFIIDGTVRVGVYCVAQLGRLMGGALMDGMVHRHQELLRASRR